jgi:hypothetical protein
MAAPASTDPITPGQYGDIYGNKITVTSRTPDGRFAVAQAATPHHTYVLSGHTILSMYPFRQPASSPFTWRATA